MCIISMVKGVKIAMRMKKGIYIVIIVIVIFTMVKGMQYYFYGEALDREINTLSRDDNYGEIEESRDEEEKETINEENNSISLTSLMEKEYDGRDLRLEEKIEENTLYTRYFITYKSGDLTISGILNVPKGNVPEGGFPVLFLNHGYIDTAVYMNGRGLRREQDYFARQGFAVFHSDYRNHAESDKDPDGENFLRFGYVEDVINAILAVQYSELSFLSKDRFGMMGHSMGGGIAQTIMVVYPGLVDAFVLYAPVSSDARDNFYRWIFRDDERVGEIEKNYGLPEASPDFWRGISPINFFDRVTKPIMIFHGTLDDSCDITWSRRTEERLISLGKEVELI
ncbi:MAG: alpha/beta fold hydrolase, partial [Candidatus Moranbacteria bacterium]|nr:alpha/beta fold hydrolase [Candidatus Moranbacteria bacterium]